MIRVLLAEDQAMLRGALAALLALESDIEVLGSAGDGESTWRELQRLRPDILVSDIEMPGLTGLELAQRIRRHELPVKVVIVTTFARTGYLRRALDAGVSGYLLKDAPVEKLADALRTVARGGRAIAPELALEAWTEAVYAEEAKIADKLHVGASAAEISRQLSRYGATNTLEWFAESFAEGMRSENPRPMAREFMLELDKILRRLR